MSDHSDTGCEMVRGLSETQEATAQCGLSKPEDKKPLQPRFILPVSALHTNFSACTQFNCIYLRALTL